MKKSRWGDRRSKPFILPKKLPPLFKKRSFSLKHSELSHQNFLNGISSGRVAEWTLAGCSYGSYFKPVFLSTFQILDGGFGLGNNNGN
jgi:hypothetical protein